MRIPEFARFSAAKRWDLGFGEEKWCSALPSCLYLERDRLQLWTFGSAGEGIQIPAQVSQTMGRRLLPKTLRPLRWFYFETKIAYLTAFFTTLASLRE